MPIHRFLGSIACSARKACAAARAAATRWRFATRCVVLGRGYNYATAFEIVLKLKELTYIAAEPYFPADFLHGPVAVVQDLREAGAELLIISDSADLFAVGPVALGLPAGVPEWLSPVTTVVAGQLFALRLTEAKGLDPDRPRRLQKVTRTH